MRTAPLPSDQFRRRSRAESELEPVHGLPGPSDRLVEVFSARQRPGLDFRRSSHVQHVASVADGLALDAVDRVEGDATVLPFVGPHDVLEMQTSAAAFVLHAIFDHLCQAPAEMHPSVLSGRIGIELKTLEGIDGGAQQSHFLHVRGRIVSIYALQLWPICGEMQQMRFSSCICYRLYACFKTRQME